MNKPTQALCACTKIP